MGIEPTTNTLKAYRSAAELAGRPLYFLNHIMICCRLQGHTSHLPKCYMGYKNVRSTAALGSVTVWIDDFFFPELHDLKKDRGLSTHSS